MKENELSHDMFLKISLLHIRKIEKKMGQIKRYGNLGFKNKTFYSEIKIKMAYIVEEITVYIYYAYVMYMR